MLSPSPLAASGMGSTVGFVGGFFRFGDLLACALSMLPGLHMTSLCHETAEMLGSQPPANTLVSDWEDETVPIVNTGKPRLLSSELQVRDLKSTRRS